MKTTRKGLARASDLLSVIHSIPDDLEFRTLRELAIDYIVEAERLDETRERGVAKPDETAALDEIVRSFFDRAIEKGGLCTSVTQGSSK